MDIIVIPCVSNQFSADSAAVVSVIKKNKITKLLNSSENLEILRKVGRMTNYLVMIQLDN